MRPEFAGILRQPETYAAADSASMGNRINGAFDRLMLHSGWGVSPAVVLFLAVVCAVAVGGTVFVWKENMLLTGLAAAAGGAVPFVIAATMRSRRQRLISQQLPAMIDELARAARTGRSLEKCIDMVAHDTPAPLGTELKQCARKMNLGVPVDEVIAELPERTGVVSTSILATALAVHRQTGGDLVHVLERLAHTLRDRLQFVGRLRAATTASRLTAFLMIGLPPMIVAFFMFRDPDYLNQLMASTWGRLTTIMAVVLMAIGSAWVLRVLASSQKP
jgi:tight adherence protein B